MPLLEKWAPLPDLDIFERRLRRFIEDVGVASSLTPAADIFETNDEIVVELDVPGYDEKELSVTVSDHVLAIVGERKETAKDEKAARIRERLESHFERRFQLPHEADSDHVHADYAKGVLTLHVPKLGDAKTRKVAITRR